MVDTIAPALTPDQWAEQHVEFGETGSIEIGVAPWGDRDRIEGANGADHEGALWVEVDDCYYSCAATFEQRHAVAALALRGQPFGFTWADVANLLAAQALFIASMGDSLPICENLNGIAVRIAALLPPRET